jgi:hypothetical protein
MNWIIAYDQDCPTTHVIMAAILAKKNLQELDVHNRMEDVETKYEVTLCWWLYSSGDMNDDFHNLSKQ